jgi:phenylpropionate dioxygenase-like ring-hydroxylating dioxygenase large terminal subunit
MSTMQRTLCRPIWGMAAAFLVAGCGRSDPVPVPASGSSHHQHLPPHGGTVVELGPDQYHLELVHEAGSDQITAYVLDGEMEKFIRISQAQFQIRVTHPSLGPLDFHAIESAATGERVGDTSEFTASTSWLKTNAVFDGTLSEIKIAGQAYRDISFNYPKGNE